MRDQPGVVQAAGYRLISDIQPKDGGKGVQVTFSKPYPGWQTLFANLLPSHVLKDAPGGWQGALAGGFPAGGGPVFVKESHTGRGEARPGGDRRGWGNTGPGRHGSLLRGG